MTLAQEKAKASWVSWLATYGADAFFDALMANVEGAESTCQYCGERIRLDFTQGGGIGDWGLDGDFGCPDSPETCEEGTGSHLPVGCPPFAVWGVYDDEGRKLITYQTEAEAEAEAEKHDARVERIA